MGLTSSSTGNKVIERDIFEKAARFRLYNSFCW